MEFESVIRGRRSIRAYEPERVPEGVIREILGAARWAPSWRNTQAWNVWVLTGGALQRFKDELKAAGEPSDPAAALARMADLFGAPCLLVFGFDDCLAEAYAGFDSGAFVQNVCLAAYDRGLGTCIVATVIRYPDILRRLLPGADGMRFVVSVTLGYPTPDAPANTFERSRADLDELVTWVS